MGGLWILRWGTNPNKNNTVEIDWVVIEMLNIIYWLGIYWLPFFGEPRLTPAAVLRPWTQLLGVKRPQAPSPETARHPAHVTRRPRRRCRNRARYRNCSKRRGLGNRCCKARCPWGRFFWVCWKSESGWGTGLKMTELTQMYWYAI